MRLTVINGSPRGKGSNTRILTQAFIEGFMSIPGNSYQEYFLNRKQEETELQRNFLNGEALLIAFPLYTDAMPGIVKEYFELLEPYKRVNPGIKIGFIIQSGFPESYHSYFVARYLKYISGFFEADYLGTIIKGGAEGYRVMPYWMKKRTLKRLTALGESFAKTGSFDKELIRKIGMPVKLSRTRILFYSIAKTLNLTNVYWNMQLKKNNAYKIRFSKPLD